MNTSLNSQNEQKRALWINPKTGNVIELAQRIIDIEEDDWNPANRNGGGFGYQNENRDYNIDGEEINGNRTRGESVRVRRRDGRIQDGTYIQCPDEEGSGESCLPIAPRRSNIRRWRDGERGSGDTNYRGVD